MSACCSIRTTGTRTALTVADIEKLRADQIVHVHINDAPDVPVEEVLDNGTIVPGRRRHRSGRLPEGLQRLAIKAPSRRRS